MLNLFVLWTILGGGLTYILLNDSNIKAKVNRGSSIGLVLLFAGGPIWWIVLVYCVVFVILE